MFHVCFFINNFIYEKKRIVPIWTIGIGVDVQKEYTIFVWRALGVYENRSVLKPILSGPFLYYISWMDILLFVFIIYVCESSSQYDNKNEEFSVMRERKSNIFVIYILLFWRY